MERMSLHLMQDKEKDKNDVDKQLSLDLNKQTKTNKQTNKH